jgi:hypothetical protein
MSTAVVEPHVEVAAYAIGSLDIDEVESFEGHLDTCRHCQRELEWLSEVVRLLTRGGPVEDVNGAVA